MTDFVFPAIHAFPPFYTLQPNLETVAAQKLQWAAIILLYHKHHNLHLMSLSAETLSGELFTNKTIDRSLKIETLRDVVELMIMQNQAEYSSRKKDEVFIYWRRPEEWAQMLQKHITDTGQNGSVLTIYELTQADEAQSSAFYQMDKKMLRKVIDVLAKKGKAVIMKGSDGEEQGIKFS